MKTRVFAVFAIVLIVLVSAVVGANAAPISRAEMSLISGGCMATPKYQCRAYDYCRAGVKCIGDNQGDPCTSCGTSILGYITWQKHKRCETNGIYNSCTAKVVSGGCGNIYNGTCQANRNGPYCRAGGSAGDPCGNRNDCDVRN